MEKIVSKGLKIDLHIHSEYSKNKDGEKVADNTLNNLPILVQGLINHQVEMCAITDHDNFNYELYSELKKEELKENCKNNGKFTIQSGALEYEDDDYSILRIVADNIEGGLQTIKGRMKRYEKDV